MLSRPDSGDPPPPTPLSLQHVDVRAGHTHTPDSAVLVAGVPRRGPDGGDLHGQSSRDGRQAGGPPPLVHHRHPAQPRLGGPVRPAILPQSRPLAQQVLVG